LEQRLQITEDRAQNGRFSIDLSLELERQLNMESPPASSSHAVNIGLPNEEEDCSKPDPDVLAHIVTHMRKSLADLTKERDDLVRMLAKVNTQEANTKDALHLMTEKATNTGEELDIARKRMKEDEEQIGLLRAKVEESRRGLMRLQTESKRQSMMSIDSRTSLALPGFGSSPSSRRASFTPLTGRPGHLRISSVSDVSSFPDLTPSPRTQTFSIASPEPHVSPPPPNPRFSGMFGQLLPPTSDLPTIIAAEPPQNHDSKPPAGVVVVDSDEVETLRKELQSVKAELATVKHDLTEAIEAKEASETCVKALREFIADNNVGVVAADGASAVSIKLPPPPTMTTGEEGLDRAKPNGGWGFKLWGVESPLISSMPFSASVAAPSPSGSVNSISTLPAAPLSRKLGGFFSSRSSLSSNSSHQQPNSPLQTNAGGVQLSLHAQSQGSSSYSFSDTSSVAEPISPGSDIHGLGTKPAGYFPEGEDGYEKMVVKDVTNLNRVHTHSLSIQDKDGIVRYEPPMTVSSSGSVDLDGLR
jgi:hypothetical protein